MTLEAHARWRVIVDPPASGSWNMAVDEAIVESVRLGAAPTLRFYAWAPPCLSLGRNQSAHALRDPAEAIGLDVVRRPTGGRAVLHDDELTYSVVVPDRWFGSARDAYRRINQVLVDGLRRLHVPATVHGPSGRRPGLDVERPCFADPVEGEVLAGQRKLIGSAQVRTAGVLLQHGSMPLGPSTLSERADWLAGHVGAPAYLRPPAVLNEGGPGLPDRETIVQSILTAWSQRCGPPVLGSLTADEIARASALRDRYTDPDWTWNGPQHRNC